jgi:hypothetical protein
MRKAEFHVPTDVVVEFVESVHEHDFEIIISGVDTDDDLILEVSYETKDARVIDKLENNLEMLIENSEEGNEEGEAENE